MRVFLSSLICVLLLSSCSIEDDSTVITYDYVVAESVVVPDSFEFGQTYDFEVSFINPDGCHIFSGFEVIPNGNQRVIRTVLSRIQPNGSCENTQPETQVESLRFQVLHTEPYVFKFLNGYDDQGNETFLEYSIPVN
jgi:hypothetical protein